jgi:predicted TIM-barrel fold metal-dependent hydrolase
VPGLLAAMDDFGIARALVTHTLAKWHDPVTGNDRLAREIAGQDRLTACRVVLPAATGEVPPETEQVDELLSSGARAARLCPVAHRLSTEPWELEPLLEALAGRRVPLLLDFDNVHWSEARPWRFIEWSCRAYPELPVVLLREAMGFFRTLFPLMDRCPNLVVEMSYLQGHDALRRMVDRWGAGRFVFGTGMPIYDPGMPIAGLAYAGLSPEAFAAVAGGTLRGLMEGCLA